MERKDAVAELEGLLALNIVLRNKVDEKKDPTTVQKYNAHIVRILGKLNAHRKKQYYYGA